MKERPILFSGPMVRAILEGRKTQTRRVMKDAPGQGQLSKPCVYGTPGDRLWVRETFRDPDTLEFFAYRADIGTHRWREYIDPDNCRWRPSIFMRRADSRITLEIADVRVQRLQQISEQDAIAEGISECPIPADEDGPNRIGYMVGPDDGKSGLDVSPCDSFRKLWDSINAKRGFGWDVNPWVWALTFKRSA